MRVEDKDYGFGFEFVPLGELSTVVETHPSVETLNLIMPEPRRYIVADAGFIVSTVVSIKRGYPRPALYGAKHPIKALKSKDLMKTYTVVGPVCESSDVFGVYELPIMKRGDKVIIENAGAYGYSMASNYNGRPKPAEYMLESENLRFIRPRQDFGFI